MPADFDAQYMEMALAEARNAERAGEVPVGAVIVIEGSVVARAFNQPVSTSDPTAHAEMVALREASRVSGNYRLSEATMYCTLEPCMMCAGAMIHARIAKLVFGALDPKAGSAGSIYNVLTDPRLNHSVKVVSGVRHAECSALLRDFFSRRRKIFE
jgi:tRNA(adenine34) deaminase